MITATGFCDMKPMMWLRFSSWSNGVRYVCSQRPMSWMRSGSKCPKKPARAKPRAVQVGTGNKSVAALGKEDLLELKLADNFLERYGVNY